MMKLELEQAIEKLEQAIEIVIELARENILTEGDARDNGLEDERNKQFDACVMVEDFAVNMLNHYPDGDVRLFLTLLAEERANFPEDE